MANNSIGSTPVVRISQLQEETNNTISANPANTWFAVVNADIMKTKRISLDNILKYIAAYLAPSEYINYLTIQTKGGLTCNTASSHVVYLGNTFVISDELTINAANASFLHANASFDHANSSYIRANNAFYKADDVYSKSNASFDHANSAYNKANTFFTVNTVGGGLRLNIVELDTVYQAQSAQIHLGDVLSITDSITYDIATSANNKAFLPISIKTTGGLTGESSAHLGETVELSGESIFNKVNSAYNYANTCITQFDTKYVYANGSIAYANCRYILTGTNLELTLQDNPKVNTYVSITNMGTSKTNKIKSVNNKLHGLPVGEMIQLNVPNITINLCYVDSIRGWVIV